jgi:hypothetical protein
MVASKSDTVKPHLHQSSVWAAFTIEVTYQGNVELVVYKMTRATMKDIRKTTKYQLLGASGYLYGNIHVGRMKLKSKTNLQHLLVVRINLFTIDVLLSHSVCLPDLPVEFCPPLLDA